MIKLLQEVLLELELVPLPVLPAPVKRGRLELLYVFVRIDGLLPVVVVLFLVANLSLFPAILLLL